MTAFVRDCASFGLPGTVRIAVPPPEGLERLDAALGAIALTVSSPSERTPSCP